MFIGCLGLLIAGFLTEIPPMLAAKLSSTNEVRGTFVQTKLTPPTERAQARRYVSKGTYRIRPEVDFTWKTCEPFETTFYATPTNYVYSNEDESVTRKLSELPGFARVEAAGKGDYSAFFDAFDALYKEEGGKFFVLAKPKVGDLKRVLKRVEAEGTVTNWILKAEFPDKTTFALEFSDF